MGAPCGAIVLLLLLRLASCKGEHGLEASAGADGAAGRRLLQKANVEFRFVGKWGTGGDEPSQFQLVQDLDVAPASLEGAVFLLDTFRVKKFTRNGTFLWQVGAQGDKPGQFIMPSALAVHPRGWVFVSDAELSRITKFDAATGKLLAIWDSGDPGFDRLSQPVGLATSPNALYVVNQGSYRVAAYEPQAGGFLYDWGTDPSGDDPDQPDSDTGSPGSFLSPNYIAIHQGTGDVYVMDAGNSRIQQFTRTGTLLRMWGSAGTGLGQFTRPRGLAVSGNFVLLLESSTSATRVQAFNSATGAYQLWFAERGSQNGQLRSPFGIVGDDKGIVWIADTGGDQLQQFKAFQLAGPPPPPQQKKPAPPPPKPPPPRPPKPPSPGPPRMMSQRPRAPDLPPPFRQPPVRFGTSRHSPPPRAPPRSAARRTPPPLVHRQVMCKPLGQQCSAAVACCAPLKCRAASPRICTAPFL